MVLEQLDIFYKKKKIVDIDLTHFTKINSKWIDINVKCKTIKLLKDNIGENQYDLGYGNDFCFVDKFNCISVLYFIITTSLQTVG